MVVEYTLELKKLAPLDDDTITTYDVAPTAEFHDSDKVVGDCAIDALAGDARIGATPATTPPVTILEDFWVR
jgi:hypothetical protein